MKELIKSLVEDYNNDRVTWHEIQDIIEGECLVHAYGDADAILQEIETLIKRRTIAQLHANYYAKYIIAQERYYAERHFSDLMDYLDYGHACGVLSKEDLRRAVDRAEYEVDRQILRKYFKL